MQDRNIPKKFLANRFKFQFPYGEIVKEYDMIALATEMRDLMQVSDHKLLTVKPVNEKLKPLSPKQAQKLFINRYANYRPN